MSMKENYFNVYNAVFLNKNKKVLYSLKPIIVECRFLLMTLWQFMELSFKIQLVDKIKLLNCSYGIMVCLETQESNYTSITS